MKRICATTLFMMGLIVLILNGCTTTPDPETAGPAGETRESVFYDFENFGLPEWSTADVFIIGDTRVLGPFNDEYRKVPDRAKLTVGDIPPGSAVELSFQLYLIGTWDSGGDMADRWTLSIDGGPTLLELTEFPCTFLDDKGRKPVDHDGWVDYRGAPRAYWVIDYTIRIAPDRIPGDRPLVLDFYGDVTGRRTENWALDNVRVDVVGP